AKLDVAAEPVNDRVEPLFDSGLLAFRGDDVHEHEAEPEPRGERRRELGGRAGLRSLTHSADDRPVHLIQDRCRRARPQWARDRIAREPKMGSRPDGGVWLSAALSPYPCRPPLRPRLQRGGTMHETLITPAGLARLIDELDRLRTTGRQEITERIRVA